MDILAWDLDTVGRLLADGGLVTKSYFESNHRWLTGAIFSAFAIVNSVRIVAYVPQILRAARDGNGASAISYTTWGLFSVSHVTTILYAAICLGDLTLALVFTGNALACVAIVVVTFVKRRQFARRTAGHAAAVRSAECTAAMHREALQRHWPSFAMAAGVACLFAAAALT